MTSLKVLAASTPVIRSSNSARVMRPSPTAVLRRSTNCSRSAVLMRRFESGTSSPAMRDDSSPYYTRWEGSPGPPGTATVAIHDRHGHAPAAAAAAHRTGSGGGPGTASLPAQVDQPEGARLPPPPARPLPAPTAAQRKS